MWLPQIMLSIKKRGAIATNEIGILQEFEGTMVRQY
jgi:hypothetical protein